MSAAVGRFSELSDEQALERAAKQLRERSERQEVSQPAPVERSEDPTLQGTVNLNGVSDAWIIGTFPEIAEWCVERMVNDPPARNATKNKVWALMREVIALRRLCSGRQQDFSPDTP